jgi:hypothetical protein
MGVPGWMGVLDANGWSAVAAACSAVAAAVSLMVAWNAKGIQGRSADFANCIEVAEQLRDAMRRVRDERDQENNEKRYEFEMRELLNLLEALALLYNDGRIAPSTKKFTETFLDEVLAWINIDNGMATLMRQSMTGDETYRELKKFEKRRKSGIRNLSRLYKNRRDVQS